MAMCAESGEPITARTAVSGANVGGLPDAHDEQDPLVIRNRVVSLLDSLFADKQVSADSVRAISVTGQMHGILLVDSQLEPCSNLVTWRDRRVLSAPDAVGNARFPGNCGCDLHPGYGLLTLSLLAAGDGISADMIASGEARVCGIADFVAAELCNELATDHSTAASWGGYDIVSWRWNDAVLERLAVPLSALPPVVDSCSPIAGLAANYSDRWGTGGDAVVCSGIGDHQAAVLACAPLDHGSCIINLGTGGQVSIVRKAYERKPGLETRPLFGPYYVMAGASLCGGWSYAYVAELLGHAMGVASDAAIEEVMDRLNGLGSDSPIDADGLIVDSRFLGSRVSRGATGAITGIDAKNLTPGNLARATANGIVDELYDYYQMTGLRATSLHASGNAVRRNPLIRDAIEDRWQMAPVISGHVEEAARGCAMLAAANLGFLDTASLFRQR